jgi:uncharacterized protein (TIGR02996 family)
MATRRGTEAFDELVRSKDLARVDEVVTALATAKGTRREAGWLAVTMWPATAALGASARQWLIDFPVAYREDLGVAAAVVGAFLVHRGSAAGFAHLEAIERSSPLLSVWRSAVTRALARFEQRATARRGPAASSTLPAGPRGAVQQAWMALVETREVAVVSTLCARLSDGPATDVVERLVALVDFPRSGEVADAAAALVDKPLVAVNVSSPLFTLLGLVLLAHGDESHRPALQSLGGKVPSLAWLELALPKVTKASPRRASPTKNASTDDDRLEAIAASPDDLDLRRAWADSLLERGDPRGEFMALQLADRALVPKELKRVTALQKKHQRAWLRTLWPAVIKDSVRFDGGVLSAVGLSFWGPAGRGPNPNDVQLATVTEVTLSGGGPHAEAFLRSPRLGRVRRLRLSASVLAALPLERLAMLERLALDVQWSPEPFTLRAASTVLAGLALGHLETLELCGTLMLDDVSVAASSRWLPQLQRLVVHSTLPQRWFEACRKHPLRQVVVEWPRHLGNATWTFTRGEAWTLAIEVATLDDEARALEALKGFEGPMRQTRPVSRPRR